MTHHSHDQERTAETITPQAYHERSKHRLDGYARGPETLDWEQQPDPFRRYAGAPLINLPLIPAERGPSFAALSSGEVPAPSTWNAENISQLLQYALGLSAWKQYGSARWSLRCNPSSGNLHPTECYPILLGIEGIEDGLYHYRPDSHQLELRCRYPAELPIDAPCVLLALSSLQWREAWKYGERAYRYCQLDVGHAVAALTYSAATLGHTLTPLLEVDSASLETLLGLERDDEFIENERETADLLLSLQPHGAVTGTLTEALLSAARKGTWQGQAERIDPRHHYDWPVMAEVSQATHRPKHEYEQEPDDSWPAPLPAASHPLAQQPALRLFQQRRSAQAYDPSGTIDSEGFFRMLDRLLPRPQLAPWSALAWGAPRIHLLLFVHNVDGLAPGLYLLARRTDATEMLKGLIRDDLPWEAVEGAPSHLPLYRLAAARARNMAAKLSCQQAIAGDGVFSLAMLAEFEASISDAPWHYNELFWEAGMLGQVLYLEAEAAGLRGTGIGCFFDDAVHTMVGISDTSLQSLYHFTVGLPLNDARLVTLPPYPQSDEAE